MESAGRSDIPGHSLTREQLLETAKIELTEFFELQPHERVVVLNDTIDASEGRYRIADVLHEVAVGMAHSELMRFSPLRRSGMDPPSDIVNLMWQADVLLIVTSRSLTHAAATIKALKRGTRIGTHTNYPESYVRAVLPPRLLKERGDRLMKVLNARPNGVLHLSSKEGTDLTVPLGDRKFVNWYGNITGPGTVENVPGSEVMIAPPEGKADGTIFVNLKLPSWASGTLPYVLEVREGRLMSCPQDEQLIRKYKARPKRDLLCEVGIGTNPKANKHAQCLMEVEKTLGTAHIAFGSNVDFGGANQTDVHMDFPFDNVTITLNGQTIMDYGKLCC